MATTPLIEPDTDTTPETGHAPTYHVVLLDDDDHTYDYVVEMLAALFGHTRARAWELAKEVDASGRAIVFTAPREQAELKVEQIHGYGADWRIERSAGAMSALLERAD